MKNILIISLLIFVSVPLKSEKQWVEKYYMELDDISTLQCIDSLNCYAFVRGGGDGHTRIVRTTDGGYSWFIQYDFDHEAEDDSVFNVAYGNVIDSLNLFMTYFYYPHVEKSTDGGKTFKRISFGEYSSEEHSGKGLLMYNKYIGVLLLFYEMIITFDGWETYKLVKIPIPGTYGKILKFINENKILMQADAREENDLVVFDISKETWEQFSINDSSDPDFGVKDIFNYYFVDDQVGFACGGQRTWVGDLEKNIISKTTDGGKHWRVVNDNEGPLPSTGLQSIAFDPTGKHGIAVGSWGVMMESTDYGETWQYLDATDMIPKTTVVRVAFAGKYPIVSTLGRGIYRYEDVTNVSEPEDNDEIEVVNNLDHLMIEMKEDYQENDISIHDLLGRKVLNQNFINQQHISLDISTMDSGPYFYRITSNAKIIKTGKFMK
jgi:photosystem II stability/assembly factor-like uncharacterized protein